MLLKKLKVRRVELRKSRALVFGLLSLVLVLAISGVVMPRVEATEAEEANGAVVTEYQITTSPNFETHPRLGNDGVSNLVVYDSYVWEQPPYVATMGPGDIWYQRLDDNGMPVGSAVQVTTGDRHDANPDVSGDYIVYTSYDSIDTTSGNITLYQISTGMTWSISRAPVVLEARIHGDIVVWRESDAVTYLQIEHVMLYNLTWLGTDHEPMMLSPKDITAFCVDVGERFVVWSECYEGPQYDVWAYDLAWGSRIGVTHTDVIEHHPSTSNDWVTWVMQDPELDQYSVQACNLATGEFLTLTDPAEEDASWAEIDGDIIAYSSNLTGNYDIYIHRLSTRSTYQVTIDPSDQYFPCVYGDLLAYVDYERHGNEDIYVVNLKPPVADINGPYTGIVGTPVTFDASGSYDPGGDITGCVWIIWPEGYPANVIAADATEEPTFTFMFTEEGTYCVAVMVFDSLGGYDEDSTTVTIMRSPYKWPMFHYGPSRSGYSTSTAPNTNFTLWTYKTDDRVISSPAISNGIVYVGSEDNNVYALNATTGALIWTYTTGADVMSSPAVANGIVYVGSLDHNVYALNATTGELIWTYTTESFVRSSPAVSFRKKQVYLEPLRGTVYIGSDDNNLYALDATTGSLRWKYNTGNAVTSSPAVYNEVVYVGSGGNNVYALNATTGELIWSYTTYGSVGTSPSVAYGMVFVGSVSDSRVYALNATTGARIWSYYTGVGIASSPAIADDKVFIGNAGSNFYALNATNGEVIWTYTAGGAIWSSPAIADGIVYIGSNDGKVYAFGGTPTNTPAGTDITTTDPTTGVTVTFNEITLSGTTSITTSNTGPETPTGFEVAGVYFDITTTATYTGPIQIAIPYDENLVIGNEEDLKIMHWNPDAQRWTDITTWVDTANNIIYGQAASLSIFAVMEPIYGTISGTVTDEYTGAPIEGVTISILEAGATTTTDTQGKYSFTDLEAGSYTIEMTLPYGHLTHDAVTKFIDVQATEDTEVNFTVYQASWSDATIPRTIGYWKNWDKHYTPEIMQIFIENVKTASGMFNTLTIDNIDTFFKITRHSTMEEKGQAQLLASWLNIVSAQLGVDVQVDISSILGWKTVIADDDGALTVNELLNQIDQLYLSDATLTKEQLETIKNILDALNNGQLFT